MEGKALTIILLVVLTVVTVAGYMLYPSEETNTQTTQTPSTYNQQLTQPSGQNYATREDVMSLTTLVYGAVGASLVAALASIISLMQISRRLAG